MMKITAANESDRHEEKERRILLRVKIQKGSPNKTLKERCKIKEKGTVDNYPRFARCQLKRNT